VSATLSQINEPLGSIEARLTSINDRMATTSELRAWMTLVVALIAAAVGVILKYR
jgi:hypothetical protein